MKSCTVSNPSNGYYKLNNSTTLANGAAVVHGNSVTMACNGGYLLTGSTVANCNNGSWSFSSNNGNCELVCSRADLNNKINGTAGSQLYPNSTAPSFNGKQYNNYNAFAIDTMVDASCKSGYTEVSTYGEITSTWGTHAYKCVNENNKGVWKRMGSCMRKCTVSNPSNGYYKLNNSTTLSNGAAIDHGANITMACNSGYTLNGSKTASCNNGSWSFSSNITECKVEYYSPSDPNLFSTKYFNKGSYVCCNNDTFTDVKINDWKACKIDGKLVKQEHDTNNCFTVSCDTSSKAVECKIKVEYYSPNNSSKYTYNYYNKGDYVCCNNDTFGDVQHDVVKACRINGIKVADENGCFTVNP